MKSRKIILDRGCRQVPSTRAEVITAFAFSFLTPLSSPAQSATELLRQADHFADLGDWHDAGPLYAKAEQAFRSSGDASNELYARFGRLHLKIEEGSYRAVRAEVTAALLNAPAQTQPLLEIRGLALLGNIDLNTDTAAALADWNQVLALAKRIGDQKWENRAKGELGLVAGVNGDIATAGAALYASITKAEQIGDVAAAISFSASLANGMSIHGMADRGFVIINRAIELAQKSGYAEVPLQLSIAKIRALTNSPETQAEANGDAVKKLIAATLAQAQKEGVLGAQTELLIEVGQIAFKNKDLGSAESAFDQAVRVSKAAALPREEADAYLHLSRFYRATRQAMKASASIDLGIRAVQRVEEAYDLPLYIAEKADVQVQLGSLRSADESFQRATDLIEGLLVNAPTSQVKSGMIGALSQIYLSHFRLAWTGLHNAQYAFSIIENARGRALFDSVRYARQSVAVPGLTSPSDAEIARLQKSLMHATMSNSQTRHTLELLDAAYVKSNRSEYERQRSEMNLARKAPVRLAALQAQLGVGESLVEYVLDENGSYAIEVSRAEVKIHPLPVRSQISKLSRTFVTAIRSGADSRASAQDLYKVLIEPVIHKGVSSLIVVPDGPLHLIPFSALVSASGAYLNTEVTLSSAPSATIYSTLKKNPRGVTARLPFLGVAFSPPSQSVQTSLTASRGLTDLRAASLRPLRFAREEVVEAAKVFGPSSVTLDGAQATEEAVKAQRLADFKVIHLAVHGVSDTTEPDRAALVLAPGSGSEDGLWQSREITRFRLNADVVVLSACETGSGRLQGQEGVMNLARAFLIAGSRSVVASLWAVDDRSTATLMESFYQHLKTGITVSEALRQAQLDFIKDYSDKAKPNLWAGFEVIGNGTSRFQFQNKSDFKAAR